MAYSLAVSQAISILLYICLKTDEGKYEFLSTKSISYFLKMPVPTAAKVLKSLSTAGLIITKEGAGGGIMLARQPSKITLLDIFTAIEREKPLFKTNFNFEVNNDRIEFLREKTLKSLRDAELSMKGSLIKVTLQDLLNNLPKYTEPMV